MGDRYILDVICPRCEAVSKDVYYAPTCGFTSTKCVECGHIIDLEEYTGITREDTSNADIIEEIIDIHRSLK